MTRNDVRTLVVILLLLAAVYGERWRMKRYRKREVLAGEDKWPFSSQFGNRFVPLDHFFSRVLSVLWRLISSLYNVLLVIGWLALGIWLLSMLNNLIQYIF